MHSGLHLAVKAAVRERTFTSSAKVSLASFPDAGATGAKPVMTIAPQQPTGCPSYSPQEGRPGFRQAAPHPCTSPAVFQAG
jgi:hypothetical protein